VNGRVRFSDKESVLSFHQTTTVSRFVKVQGNKSPYDGDWVYWSTRLGRDPGKPRRLKRTAWRLRTLWIALHDRGRDRSKYITTTGTTTTTPLTTYA
jgi:hypothetical protein